jgi:hypothetical protein
MHLAACLVLALVPCVAGADAPANLLANPGFEGDVAPDGMPAGGWYRSYGDANSKWILQTGGAHSGDKCMRLEAPTIPEHNPSVSIEQAVPVTPGKRYALRLWTRGEPKGAEGMIFIVWLTKDRGWINVSGGSFRYGSEWEQHRVDGTAPEGAAFGVARVDIRQPGTAWVDDEYLGERRVVRITANVRDGTIAAGGRFRLEARPLDFDGAAVLSAPVSAEVSSAGDAVFPPAEAGDTPVRRVAAVTNESGIAAFSVRASSRPGVTDTITLTSGDALLRMRIKTAVHGDPAAYAVTPDRRAALPGAEVPVRVQLVGAYGEAVPIAGRKASVAVAGSGWASPSVITTDGQGRATVRVRMSKDLFARATVTVSDDAGLSGRSPSIIVSPPIRTDQVRVGPNGYFLHADGKPFMPLGGLYGNFVHKVEGGVRGDMISSSIADATDEQLRAHFAYLRDNGVTALRVMLRDHTKIGCEPMDAIGKVNLDLLRRWEHYMEVARPYGLRFLVTLHESWYATYASYFNADCMEKCVLPRYTADELRTLPAYRRRFLVEKRMLVQLTDALSDPDALACQRDYLTDLIPRLRGNPDIFAYEIENEQPNGFFSWTEDQIRLLRELDPSTPVCVSHLGAGLLSADPLPWSARTGIDFYTYHTYPGGDCTSKDMDYGTTVAITARYSRLGKPAFSGESFGDEWFKATPAARHLGARDDIWSQLCAGTPGCFFWDTCDEPIKEFHLARQVMGGIDLAHLRRANPKLGIKVAHPLAADVFFQSPAGRALYTAMGRIAQACFRRGVDFDFTFDNSSYATRLNVTDADALARLKPEVQVPDGHEAQYLLSDDAGTFLCYVRNTAGPAQITPDPAQGWTRMRQPVPLSVTINLPLKPRRLTAIDLDTGAASQVTISPGRPIDLGTTDHDFLITTSTAK